MAEQNHHIVSRFRWQTSFDQREQAVVLQQRIGSWSKTTLPREMKAVFDGLCPIGQTWRIPTLELDLGTINWNQLEKELSAKFRSQLKETLTSLLLNAAHPDAAFEILTSGASQIDRLRHFLIHGTLPWHTPEDDAFNKLMAVQLQKNKPQLIVMLRGAAKAHAAVRKRLAWQLDEPNIIGVVEGLEPANHKPIVLFAEAMTQIQQQRNVVQSNALDFRKNLWLWIFNYLLTDRGTVFNKTAFMKSSLEQMASHYNVAYAEILSLIRLALHQVPLRSGNKTDFLAVLVILSKEKPGDLHAPDAQEAWLLLERHLTINVLRKKTGTKQQIGYLMTRLSGQDPNRFKAIVLDFGAASGPWSALAQTLDRQAMGTVLKTVSRSAAQTIDLLHQLSGKAGLALDYVFLWEMALRFLTDSKNTSFSHTAFLDHMLTAIQKKKRLDRNVLLAKWLTAKVPMHIKQPHHLDNYRNLTDAFPIGLPKNTDAFPVELFTQLLQQLPQLADSSCHHQQRENLMELLCRLIRIDSKSAWKTLRAWEDKKQLQHMAPWLIAHKEISFLLLRSHPELETLESFLSQLSQKTPDAPMIKALSRLRHKMLEMMLVHHMDSASQGIAIFLQEILRWLTPSQRQLLEDALVESSKSGQGFQGILGWTPLQIQQEIQHQHKRTPRQQIESAMAIPGRQAIVAQLLQCQFSNEMSKWESGKNAWLESVFAYLLPDGPTEIQTLLHKYRSILKAHSQTPDGLTALMGQCLADYASYSGNPDEFRKAFHWAFCLTYPLKLTDAKDSKPTPNNNHPIQKCLSLCCATFSEKGKTHVLPKLLEQMLHSHPAALRKILGQTPHSRERAQLLDQSCDWWLFSLRIGWGADRQTKEWLETLRSLFGFIAHFSPALLAQFRTDFWEQTWQLVGSKTRDGAKQKAFVDRKLEQVFAQQELHAEAISEAINTHHIWISPGLKMRLRTYHPLLAALASRRYIPSNETLLRCEKMGSLENLLRHLASQKKLPIWYRAIENESPQKVWGALLRHYPTIGLEANLTAEQYPGLWKKWHFEQWLEGISHYRNFSPQWQEAMQRWYTALGWIVLDPIKPSALQRFFFRLLVRWYSGAQAKAISFEKIWRELIWEIDRKVPSKNQWRVACEAIKYRLPATVRLAYEAVAQEAVKPVPVIPMLPPTPKNHPVEGIRVRNAGIVLLNNYIALLFERLGIVANNQFTHIGAQLDAVHYLQYVATGLCRTEEALLPLNKILCGLSLIMPVKDEIALTQGQKQLINGLIEAVISHWPSAGDASIDGFRGNWLVRDGLLSEKADRWELTVEKRPYDLLIHQAPFSFSIIRYPWMNKPLHVVWPY
ncbi:contractile injection system tape measure protein [Flavobacterium sp.]|uniref:contractile injection system tape measure protein n=1 Tax=Flavobacterium sp. TaxID=239 RepID=UPI0039E30BA1